MWEFAIFSASPHPSSHPCMSLNYAPIYLKIGMNGSQYAKLPIQNILNYIRYGLKHLKFPNFFLILSSVSLQQNVDSYSSNWVNQVRHLPPDDTGCKYTLIIVVLYLAGETKF